MKISGIYCIFNKATSKRYIGQTIDFDRRKKCHLAMLRHNHHYNDYLQNSYNRYGEQSFDIFLIEAVEPNRALLDEREKYWIAFYKSFFANKGYNLSFGGTGKEAVTEETKKKLSKSLLGNTHIKDSGIMVKNTIRQGIPNPHSSKYVGVSYVPYSRNWKATVAKKYLGLYETEEDAAPAYDICALDKYGENAKTNFSKEYINTHTPLKAYSKKTSRYKGVSFSSYDGKWIAVIDFNKKTYRLGKHDTEESARMAYLNKKRELLSKTAELSELLY